MTCPKRIYLQCEGDTMGEWEGVTWCSEMINDNDVEYIRKDIVDKLIELWMNCEAEFSEYSEMVKAVLAKAEGNE